MRVALVGCGHVAAQHLRQLRRLRGVEVVGVSDRDSEHAQSFARAHGVRAAYSELDALLRETRPDVVHVLTPPESHRELCLQVLTAGSHVLVEKPMAMHAAEAREMAAAARTSGRSLGVCHNFLFVPAFQAAAECIARGEIGRVISAEVYWRVSSLEAGGRYEGASWIHALPGGEFHEVGPHLVSLLTALLGRLEVVAALRTPAVAAAADAEELRVLLRSPNAAATLTIALRALPLQKVVRIWGTEGSLQVDLATSTLLRLRPWGTGLPARVLLNLDQSAQLVGQTIGNGWRTIWGRLPRGHEGLLSAFYASLAAGATPPVRAEDGVAVVEVLDQIWSALAQAGPVAPGDTA